MKTKSNYQSIRSLEDLDAAIVRNKGRIERKGQAVTDRFADVQAFYTPQHLLTQGLRQTALNLNFYRNALGIVGALKQKLLK